MIRTPTVEGYYWAMQQGGKEWEPVSVILDESSPRADLIVLVHGDETGYSLDGFVWLAGPLSLPTPGG